jgi:hypothetical protein
MFEAEKYRSMSVMNTTTCFENVLVLLGPIDVLRSPIIGQCPYSWTNHFSLGNQQV